ncbi:MAG TPA: tetratricopeptide repeat protein, partial [Pyrinomonadaceae bacterium]
MSLDRSQISALGRFLTIVCVIVLTGPQLLQAQTANDLGNRLQAAATLIRDDRLAEAERQLLGILKSNSNQADALNLLGAVRAKQRRWEEAEKLFSRAIRANGTLISARMNLVQLYLIQHQAEKAISELNQVLRLQPENSEAFDRLSSLLLSEKRFDEFINLIERDENARPLSFSSRLALAEAYLEKRDAGKAEKNFRLALEQQSDDADAILGLAQVAFLRGDAASASSYLDRAKKSPIKSAETLRKFGLVAFQAGRYEEANLALSEAVKLKPDD